jgi:hypothetical protein
VQGGKPVCVAWTTGGRVRDGQPSSPFKKKKEEGICNSPLIKIIFSTNHLLAKMSEGTTGAPM